MEKSDFDRLMERYVRGEVSEDERLKIEAWLEMIGKPETPDVELSREEEDRIYSKLTSRFGEVRDVPVPHVLRKLRPDQWIVRVAASLVFISLISYFGWQLVVSRNEMALRSDRVDKVILNDGTLVWLRGDSRLAFYEKPDGIRFATLQGEALFEVAKDSLQPFVIACGGKTVTVLGTSFNVKATGRHVEVLVLTGNVNLSSDKDSLGVDLSPGEKASSDSTGRIETVKAKHDELLAVTLDTQYEMRFTDDSMGQVIARIESKYNVKVNLSNDQLRECRITADFTDSSLASSLEMIQDVLPIQYSIDGSEVTITGIGCQ